jgi:hypothetical protein
MNRNLLFLVFHCVPRMLQRFWSCLKVINSARRAAIQRLKRCAPKRPKSLVLHLRLPKQALQRSVFVVVVSLFFLSMTVFVCAVESISERGFDVSCKGRCVVGCSSNAEAKSRRSRVWRGRDEAVVSASGTAQLRQDFQKRAGCRRNSAVGRLANQCRAIVVFCFCGFAEKRGAASGGGAGHDGAAAKVAQKQAIFNGLSEVSMLCVAHQALWQVFSRRADSPTLSPRNTGPSDTSPRKSTSPGNMLRAKVSPRKDNRSSTPVFGRRKVDVVVVALLCADGQKTRLLLEAKTCPPLLQNLFLPLLLCPLASLWRTPAPWLRLTRSCKKSLEGRVLNVHLIFFFFFFFFFFFLSESDNQIFRFDAFFHNKRGGRPCGWFLSFVERQINLEHVYLQDGKTDSSCSYDAFVQARGHRCDTCSSW